MPQRRTVPGPPGRTRGPGYTKTATPSPPGRRVGWWCTDSRPAGGSSVRHCHGPTLAGSPPSTARVHRTGTPRQARTGAPTASVAVPVWSPVNGWWDRAYGRGAGRGTGYAAPPSRRGCMRATAQGCLHGYVRRPSDLLLGKSPGRWAGGGDTHPCVPARMHPSRGWGGPGAGRGEGERGPFSGGRGGLCVGNRSTPLCTDGTRRVPGSTPSPSSGREKCLQVYELRACPCVGCRHARAAPLRTGMGRYTDACVAHA